MEKITGKLTVFFEDPFWIGVFERVIGNKLSACKVTFGPEPSEADLYGFVLEQYYQLEFSQSVEYIPKKAASNPKRRQREAGKAIQNAGIGTKSQQALQMQREERKTERSHCSKEQKLMEKQRKFDLKRSKRKEKHRGH